MAVVMLQPLLLPDDFVPQMAWPLSAHSILASPHSILSRLMVMLHHITGFLLLLLLLLGRLWMQTRRRP
jgi:hypothetical protein